MLLCGWQWQLCRAQVLAASQKDALWRQFSIFALRYGTPATPRESWCLLCAASEGFTKLYSPQHPLRLTP